MNIWKIKNRAGYFWRNKDDVELKEINQESSSRVSSFLKTKTVETITDGVFAFGFFFFRSSVFSSGFSSFSQQSHNVFITRAGFITERSPLPPAVNVKFD